MKQMQATENHNFHFFQFQKMIVNKKMIFKIYTQVLIPQSPVLMLKKMIYPTLSEIISDIDLQEVSL